MVLFENYFDRGPNTSQYHPDHIPSKFPTVYKQSVEQQSERMKRTIDGQLRVQQAINVQEAKNRPRKNH